MNNNKKGIDKETIIELVKIVGQTTNNKIIIQAINSKIIEEKLVKIK